MAKLKIKKSGKETSCCKPYKCGQGGAVYGLGMIGAAIYYIGQAATFWVGVLGLLKALVWPIFLVYALLKFIGA